MKEKKKKILILIVGLAVLGILGLTVLNKLRGHGYFSMVKNYVHYYLNKPDLSQYEPLEEGKAEWLDSAAAIAHALGGVGESVYTDSKEAFLTSYEKGFRVFEVDLALTADGKVVCSHEFESSNGNALNYREFMDFKIEDIYTPLDLAELMKLVAANEDVYLMTDFKWDNSAGSDNREVTVIMSKIVEAAKAAGGEALLERLLVQFYNPKSYEMMEEVYPFSNYVFTLYHYAKPIYEDILAFCLENQIPVVGLESSRATEEVIRYFNDWNIEVIVYTVNEPEEAQRLFDYGAAGVYTDWLLPEELNQMAGKKETLD